MAGPVLHFGVKRSRRWCLVTVVVFLVTAVSIFTGLHARQDNHGELRFPRPEVTSNLAEDIHTKQFTKPDGVKIIGLVFFGRKNRVEILRCFLEVGLHLVYNKR